MSKKATVKLFMHALESNGLMARLFGGFLFATPEGGKHWALVVQFEGDSEVYLCELCRDPEVETDKGSGGIKWICKKMTKEQVKEGKHCMSVYYIGTIQTTPEELYETCRSIRYNGEEYHVILRNCQHWVKDLIKKLGFSTDWLEMRFLGTLDRRHQKIGSMLVEPSSYNYKSLDKCEL